MRWMVCLLCACVVAVHSAPAPSDDKDYASTLPLQIQEALQKLHLAEQNVYIEDASRDKRNIAIIKEIFPGLSNIIDSKIQMITQSVFRIIGRLLLNSGALGGGGGTGGGGGGGSNRTVSITLPTYPPDLEDEEEEEDQTTNGDAVQTTLSPVTYASLV